MKLTSRLPLLPIAALCLVAAGCQTSEFSHYEPTVIPLDSAAVYQAELDLAPQPADASVLYAEPLGLREGYRGLVVDLLLRGDPVRDRLLPGQVRATEPVPLLAVSISDQSGRLDAAGPPKKIVDSSQLSPLGTFIDPADSLFICILDLQSGVPSRIVSIPVVPSRPVPRGGVCYVRVLTELPSESRMKAWLPPGTRIVTPERALTVK